MTAPTTATTYAWRRDDRTEGHDGHSLGRVEQDADGGWLVHGTEVLVGVERLSCSFRVRLDAAWRTRDVDVTSVSADGERRLVLEVHDRDGVRRWSVDGVHEPRLDGCVDVDVAATPLTNTFPIRRLADLAVGESVVSPVAWVDVPGLGVTRVAQTYERLPDDAVGSDVADGSTAWEYSDPAHGAFRLTVDADGVVTDYEGFARRVP